ncbi:hypothetical protein C1H46_022568 [Malus baccata]|uniref:Uncharacterized protein n=1 Tax=Malus baccata TaxID=106549 RepID=A0A540LZJ4_MALBA|nr:hypothetical protein C1H46_022568 [Malus baccata]
MEPDAIKLSPSALRIQVFDSLEGLVTPATTAPTNNYRTLVSVVAGCDFMFFFGYFCSASTTLWSGFEQLCGRETTLWSGFEQLCGRDFQLRRLSFSQRQGIPHNHPQPPPYGSGVGDSSAIFFVIFAFLAILAVTVLPTSSTISILHQVPEGHVGVYWRGGALLKTITDPGDVL